RFDDAEFHVFQGSVVEAAASLILGEDGGVAGSEPETGGALPFVGEAVNPVQFHRAVNVNEMGEHASPADCSELAGVADEDDAPVVLVGVAGQVGEFGGGGGGGLIHDHSGVGTEGIAAFGWPVGVGVFG